MYIDDITKQRLNALPILDVARELGIDVINEKKALCFMHDDRNPSLIFNRNKNIWSCFVCGKTGGPINLVKEKLNLKFPEACKWLCVRFNVPCNGINKKDYYRYKDRVNVSKKKEFVKEHDSCHRDADTELFSWIINNAGLSEEAESFLFKERKYSKEVVTRMEIKSINDPQKFKDAIYKRFGRDRVIASGVFLQGKYGDYMFSRTPCVLFPYKDINGNIINIQSRYLRSTDKKSRYRFIPGLRTGIFNMPVLNSITNKEALFISEGATDCLALLSAGYKCIAIPGSGALHDNDIPLFAYANLFMYPDKDTAGENLYNQLYNKISILGNTIKRLELPEGCKDYSDYYISIKEKER